jgi:hypothetical protein
MGTIPVPQVDIVILDQIGKPISGAGMDTKVVNRSVNGEYNCWFDRPKIDRVYVRDLHPNSYGNAVGLGMADVVHTRLVEKIDWVPTRINSLTASTPAAIRTPIHFPTDRECIERIMPTVGKFNMKEVSFCWIRNTLELSHLYLSENLLDEIKSNPQLEITGAPFEFPFTAEGQMEELFGARETSLQSH